MEGLKGKGCSTFQNSFSRKGGGHLDFLFGGGPKKKKRRAIFGGTVGGGGGADGKGGKKDGRSWKK